MKSDMSIPKYIISAYIEEKEDILGGTPVFKGTRIPLERVYYLATEQNYSLGDIKEDFPALKEEAIAFALWYSKKLGEQTPA